jgi:hypothetical protein
MNMNQLIAKLTSFSQEGRKISQDNANRRILKVKELLETRNLCVVDRPSLRIRASKEDDPPAILSIAEEKAIARATIRLLELRSKGESRIHELLESLDTEKTSGDLANRAILEDIFLVIKDVRRILPNKCLGGKHYVNFQIEPVGTTEEENEILKRALEKNTFLSKEEREYLFSIVKVESVDAKYSTLKTPKYLLPRPEIAPAVPSTAASHNIFRKENDKIEIHINLANEVKGKRFKRKSLRKAKRKVKKRKHSFIAQNQEHQESDSQESY